MSRLQFPVLLVLQNESIPVQYYMSAVYYSSSVLGVYKIVLFCGGKGVRACVCVCVCVCVFRESFYFTLFQ